MVVATGKDEANANIAFTVRELVDNRVRVVTLAKSEASVDIRVELPFSVKSTARTPTSLKRHSIGRTAWP